MDARDAWLRALEEIETPPHVHDFKLLGESSAGKVFNCACGERRISKGSPSDVGSCVREGGSIANCLFAELRDGMMLSYPLLGDNEPQGGPYYLPAEVRDKLQISRPNQNLGFDATGSAG